MNWPKMVHIAEQDVTVCVGSTELNEDGELMQGDPKQLKCNMQLNAFEKLTADKRMLTLSGKALFDGDPWPEMPTLSSGSLIYDGQTYSIYKGQKNYNPDGSVNYTSLELM